MARSTTRFQFLMLGTAVACVMAAPALAQSAAAPAAVPATLPAPSSEIDHSLEDEPIIVSASRTVSSPHEIGSAITLITAGEMERNQVTFLKDALQEVPGVITTSDRPGDATSVSIRGSNNDEVLWLVDGIELGDPSSTSTQHQSDHMIAADIASVEVLRGNQSSLYGSDAIGGVINIVTKRATKDGVEANAEIEGGSHGTLNGGASILAKSGAFDLRLSATGYRHDGPSLADPSTSSPPAKERDEYWRYGFSGRAGVAATHNLSFQLIGFWLDSFSDIDGTDYLTAQPIDTSDTVKKREYAFAGQGEYESDDGSLTGTATASRYATRRLYFGDSNRLDGDIYKGVKDQLALNLKYDPRGGIFSIAAGVNMEWEETDQITNYADPFSASINTKSAYGEIALRPLHGLTLTGAARVDDNSRFGTFDTYRGTLAYVLGAAKLRASYGTGAKAPGLYQLFDPLYGNPNLKAETSHSFDAGVDFTLSSRVTAQVTYFSLAKENEIVWDSSRAPFGGYDQWGRSKAHGVEFGVAATLFDWLRLSQTFTYVDHKQDDDGDGVYASSGRSNYNAASSVTVMPTERVELTLRGRFRDKDTSGWGGATKAHAVFDLLGSYQARENVQFYGRIINLFDKDYQVAYGTNTLGFSGYVGVRLGL